MSVSRKDSFTIQSLQIGDAFLVWFAFWMASLMREVLRDFTSLPVSSDEGLFAMAWALYIAVPFTPLVLERFGFYNRMGSKSSGKAAWQLIQAIFIIGLAISLYALFGQITGTRRLILGIGAIFIFLILFARDRVTTSVLARRRRSGNGGERVVFAGSDFEIDEFLSDLEPEVTEQWDIVENFDLANRDSGELFQLLKRESIGRVIFATKNTPFDKVAQGVEICELQGVEAWIAASFIRAQIARPVFDSVGSKPMLVLRSTPELSWELMAKEIIDRSFSAIAILLTLPFWIFAAIGIRIASPGAPVIFSQMRAGRYGKPFRMWKFRTMVSNAEELLDEIKKQHGNQMDGPVFKLDSDPRIFAFGALLRKLSIDELPQLLNVLAGDMSLVGPRPLPLYEVEAFGEISHRRRLSVKPGITCLWQAGGRNQITCFEDWVAMDLRYIDNWSLWLDFQILLRTLPAGTFRERRQVTLWKIRFDPTYARCLIRLPHVGIHPICGCRPAAPDLGLGPTMVCLSLASLLALPTIWRERRSSGDLMIAFCGSALVAWIMVRAFLSPVAEMAQSDMLLAAMAVATFLSLRAIRQDAAAQKVFVSGIVLIVGASIYVTCRQIAEPGFSVIFPSKLKGWPSGFYGHYSYGASFLLGTSFLLAGLAFAYARNPLARILLGLLSAAALCAIYYTRSRGAFIGGLGGFLTFIGLILMVAKRDDRKWFGPAVIGFPVLIGIAVFAFLPLAADLFSQRSRGGPIFDNTIRLHLLGIAFSCIQLHPLVGGGSRSFSWECFQFWDVEQMGRGTHKPEHVHNELVQTASDYGIIGATLLLIVLGTALMSALIRSARSPGKSPDPFSDAMRIGGAAGFIALFLQSSFEGILRIPPGAILLAICLSGICLNKPTNAGKPIIPQFKALLLIFFCVASSAMLAFFGIKGSRSTLILWSGFFGKDIDAVETKIDAAGRAIRIWPSHTLVLHRAILYQKMAGLPEYYQESERLLELSLADFREAGDFIRSIRPP